MIEKIILENVTNRERIELNQIGDSGYVFKNEDIDWGTADAKHNVYTYPGQIGSYISSTNVKERKVTIKGYVVYMPTKGEIPSLSTLEEKLSEGKAKLSKIVNPLQQLKVIVGDYYILGKPYSSVKFSAKEKENNEYFSKFTISLYCNNPLFHRATRLQTLLSGSAPAFHFPLVLKNTGFIFGRRYNYKLIAVKNDGDIPVGAIFRIRANGPVKNVKIENIYTREFFTIQKTLNEGEEVVVNTTEGIERSIKGRIGNGVEQSYFQYWAFEGDWMQFPPGTSLIGYSVEEGSEQSADVSLELNPQRYSLGEM